MLRFPTRAALAALLAVPAPSQGLASVQSAGPPAFVPNGGQWEAAARFLARRSGECLWICDRGFVSTVRVDNERAIAVRTTFDAARAAKPEGERLLEGRHNFLCGDDRRAWATGLPGYAEVRWAEIYPGVDAVVRHGEGRFAYEFHLAAHADDAGIALAVDGGRALELADDGALCVRTDAGTLAHSAPVAFEPLADGGRRPVAVRFRLLDAQRFGFEVRGRTPGAPLCIDPGLTWSLVQGGSGSDRFVDLATIGSDVVALGSSTSATFPTTPGVFATSLSGTQDAVVQRLNRATGALVYSTYFGGNGSEDPRTLAVRATGEVVLAGSTASTPFPTTPGAFQTTPAGGGDAFVTQLDAAGSSLVFSTLLGGNDTESTYDVFESPSGDWWLTGETRSTNFPIVGTFGTALAGGADAFAAQLSANGQQLTISCYLGGTGTDRGEAIVWSPIFDGPVIAGDTNSASFPTTAGAFQTTIGGGFDVFVAYLSTAWDQLASSTFVGGSGSDQFAACDRIGLVFAGHTTSTNFPVVMPFQAANAGATDAFVFTHVPGALVQSTYFGGTNGEVVRDLQVDAAGIVVAGTSIGSGLPTTAGSVQPATAGGNFDGFVARFDRDLATLLYCTYLGGNGDDEVFGAELGADGSLVLGGSTNSTNFPGIGTWQGGNDAFVASLDGLPTGVVRYGAPSSMFGAPTAFAGVVKMPQAGDPTFAFAGWGAPWPWVGVLALGLAPDVPGTTILGGVQLHIDVSQPFVTFTVLAGQNGVATLPASLANNATGDRLFAQFLWIGPAGGQFAMSDAIDITVQ